MRWFTSCLLLLCYVQFAGCIADTNLPEVAEAQMGDTGNSFPLTITDALDREVTFASSPERVISVAPKNTELLFALGLQDRLVGVTTFCNYPPEAKELDKVGGFTAQTINQELIVALNPDLILCSDLMHEPLIPQWEKLGIPVFVLGAESLESMYEEMAHLGRIFSAPEAANQLTTSLKGRVETIRQTIQEIPEKDRPKVFYQVWDEPLMGAGPSSFIGEILELAGGQNIMADVEEPYPYVSHEVVVERNPSFIFAPTTHSQEVIPEKIAQQPGWKGIEASRRNQIFLLDGDQVSRRGPRMIDALETMAAYMFPKQLGHHLENQSAAKGGSE